jgi:hypothetical protein
MSSALWGTGSRKGNRALLLLRKGLRRDSSIAMRFSACSFFLFLSYVGRSYPTWWRAKAGPVGLEKTLPPRLDASVAQRYVKYFLAGKAMSGPWL